MTFNPAPKPKHKRRKPKQSSRGDFSKETRMDAVERDQGMCQQCLGQGEELHHVMFKSRGGRGVLTNALTLCSSCHRKVHMDAELTDYWIDVFADRYGPEFYKDEFDYE